MHFSSPRRSQGKLMLYLWRRRLDLVNVFGAGSVSKFITGPIFTKHAWRVHLGIYGLKQT